MLGRELTHTEKGFHVKFNDELVQSIVELAGISGGKVVKLPGGVGSHHTKEEDLPLDTEMNNF